MPLLLNTLCLLPSNSRDSAACSALASSNKVVLISADNLVSTRWEPPDNPYFAVCACVQHRLG